MPGRKHFFSPVHYRIKDCTTCWLQVSNSRLVFRTGCGFRLYRFLIIAFLAHLSRRLIWSAYRIGRSPSSVVRRRPSSSTLFKHLLLGNQFWPIKVIFHMALLLDRGTKDCSNGPDHMTKMATMLIYYKNIKKSSSPESKGWWPWILVCIIGCLSTTKFAQLMLLGWPWPILRQGQIWSLMLLHGIKVKQWIDNQPKYTLKFLNDFRKYTLTAARFRNPIHI